LRSAKRRSCSTAVAPEVVASGLAASGIEAALGDYYTPRLMRTLAPETGGIAVRLSFSHYNDTADVDRCFAALDAVRESTAPTIRL
jgi:selenocysteine lyase/cysteine desulfurase